jgi:hypothetical protein
MNTTTGKEQRFESVQDRELIARDYFSRSAKDAVRSNYGDRSYWNYLDAHAAELAEKGIEDAYTRTLSEALQGNEGI